jgi:hypothetical protein
MRGKTRALFEESYDGERNYARLLDIYEAARRESLDARSCSRS